MRIKTVLLSWFRGAADPVPLELDCKSTVVYGTNGAGKSSFVDAVEYVLADGKIGHLTHEYSGKHHVHAIPNTHKPKGRTTELTISLQDDSEVKIAIHDNGTAATTGAAVLAVGSWDYKRTVLRQDEVAGFIHATKGGKYSALLPLLGLHELEVAAQNIRQLVPAIERRAKLDETRAALMAVTATRRAVFGAAKDEEILRRVESLHAKYCGSRTATTDPLKRSKEVVEALDARIAAYDVDQRSHHAIREIAALDIKSLVIAARSARAKLADAVEPLIVEQLRVLEAADSYAHQLSEDSEIDCPACGQRIAASSFRTHVASERERLRATIQAYEDVKVASACVCDAVQSLKTILAKPALSLWRDVLAHDGCAAGLTYLDALDVGALRVRCGDEEMKAIELQFVPVIDAAVIASASAPPDVQAIAADKQVIEAAQAVIGARPNAGAVTRAEQLVAFVSSLEDGVRDEIRVRSQAVLKSISSDVQSMWSVLHPGEPIEGVRLYVPGDADKAIDIGLKFHGVAQNSPRLTLSEGYRNSLGLCIFLAMAKREAEKDRPVFLDDVVISLDRNHRGMIVELLQTEFSGRQVVILTHDRDWYAELRQQLDGKGWAFKALLPYENPKIGIRWSHKTSTFDDARALLKDRPDAAGNDVRKIMDVELALIAERVQVRLPYLRGDKNDKRMAHELLARLVEDGKTCLQRREGKGYVAHSAAITALDDADRLLTSWANRGSHTFDVVRPEAVKLIDVCEKALAALRCSTCVKPTWFADVANSESVQCQCSGLRWRYGKA